MAKKALELFVEARASKIVDQDRKEVSLAEAQRLWNAGKVTNFSMSFQRLATRANWDFNELRRQYAEMEAARGR